MRRLLIASCFLLLIFQLVIQLRLASTDSQTTDEAVHLSAGYTYLTTGDFRFNPEHPPLVKILAAIPLLFIKPNQPVGFDSFWQGASVFTYDSWQENRTYGELLLYGAGNNPDQLIFWGRIPVILITFLLGLMIMFISLKHWGGWAAITAISLYVFNPIITGHGHLITTDLALALGFLWSTYAAWQFAESPSQRTALWLGLAIGFALIVKHTAIIILPGVLVMFGALYIFRRDKSWAIKVLKHSWSIPIIIWLMIWVSYGFAIPEGQRLSILPPDYIKGISLVVNHASDGHNSFLLGQFSQTGWWYYFPFLLIVKTPLPAIMLTLTALVIVAARRTRPTLVLTLAGAAALFLIIAMTSKANLGVRHVMPILPLLALITGWVVNYYPKSRPFAVTMLLSLVIIFGISQPNNLGYYNQLVGGSTNGYKIATDSNLDWGQDLKRIAAYIKTEQLIEPYIQYNWLGDAALDYYLGDNFRRLSNSTPAPGEVVIINATDFNYPEYLHFTTNCERRLITSGTFACIVK